MSQNKLYRFFFSIFLIDFLSFPKVNFRVKTSFNKQYMRNPDMVYVLKMEYVSKINIFGLKLMVKSGLEKIFLKFLHAQDPFQTS